MLLLFNRQLLDPLLKLLLHFLALLEFVLHVAESLGAAHCVDLLLEGEDLALLLLNLLVDAGEFVLLEVDLVLGVVGLA